MISYNPKDWTRFIFRIHREDTLLKLIPLLVAVGLYSALLAWLELHVFHLPPDSPVRQFTVLHTLLGFVISLLLVFRTNTAYDRWWEGRKLWGSLVNSSRNLAMKMNAILSQGDEHNRSFFRQIIPRFSLELMRHLQKEETRMALDANPHPEIPDFDTSKHIPNQVAELIAQKIYTLNRQGTFHNEALLSVMSELNNFLDVCGACERIKNTPIPYSYSAFIKKFILFYVLTLPIGFVFNLGYFIIPVVMLVFYVLGSLELIAEEIEDPFGKDANDLPMDRICTTIQRNVTDLLR